jgi:hypothetical protein
VSGCMIMAAERIMQGGSQSEEGYRRARSETKGDGKEEGGEKRAGRNVPLPIIQRFDTGRNMGRGGPNAVPLRPRFPPLRVVQQPLPAPAEALGLPQPARLFVRARPGQNPTTQEEAGRQNITHMVELLELLELLECCAGRSTATLHCTVLHCTAQYAPTAAARRRPTCR